MCFDGLYLSKESFYFNIGHLTVYEFSENLYPARLQCVKFDGRIKIVKNACGNKTDQMIRPCGMVSLQRIKRNEVTALHG